MNYFLIIPTYNEKENLERLINCIFDSVPFLNVIVVDDNSPDGTGQLADEIAKRDDRVMVLHRSQKLGLGTAYVAGFKHAFELGADYVLTMDADFSHDPANLPSLIEASKNADVVIGSRYVNQGKTVNFSFYRRLISRSANLFARSILHLRAFDCTSGYRCYKRESLQSIELASILSNGYSFLMELLYRCQNKGMVIKEVPICYVARVQGLSKISKTEILNAFLTIFRLKCERIRERINRWLKK